MQARVFWHWGADNYLDLVGLKNRFTGDYPADAVVTATLRTRLGAAVTGASNLSMPYVAGTTGDQTTYRLFAQDTLAIPIGLYEATVTASKDGVVEKLYVPITVEKG